MRKRLCQNRMRYRRLLYPRNAIEPAKNGFSASSKIARTAEFLSRAPRSLNSRRAEEVNSTLQFVSILAEHAVQAVPAFLLQTLGTDDTVGIVIGDLHGVGDRSEGHTSE